MDQKSKERKEQDIRSSWYYIHYCYCYRSPESAEFVYHDRRVFRLGLKKERLSQVLRNASKSEDKRARAKSQFAIKGGVNADVTIKPESLS